MTESELWKTKIKPFLSANGIYGHRVEATHIPDVYMSKNNVVVWGELKCINKEQKIIKPDWRPGQLAWINGLTRYGNNNVYLILYYTGEVYFLPPKEKYSREELICQKEIFLKMMKRRDLI